MGLVHNSFLLVVEQEIWLRKMPKTPSILTTIFVFKNVKILMTVVLLRKLCEKSLIKC